MQACGDDRPAPDTAGEREYKGRGPFLRDNWTSGAFGPHVSLAQSISSCLNDALFYYNTYTDRIGIIARGATGTTTHDVITLEVECAKDGPEGFTVEWH